MWQSFVSRGSAEAASVMKGQELHYVRQFQPETPKPWQGMARPSSQYGGIWGETYLRKGRKHYPSVNSEDKKCEKQPCEYQGQRRRRRTYSWRWIRDSPAPHGEDPLGGRGVKNKRIKLRKGRTR